MGFYYFPIPKWVREHPNLSTIWEACLGCACTVWFFYSNTSLFFTWTPFFWCSFQIVSCWSSKNISFWISFFLSTWAFGRWEPHETLGIWARLEKGATPYNPMNEARSMWKKLGISSGMSSLRRWTELVPAGLLYGYICIVYTYTYIHIHIYMYTCTCTIIHIYTLYIYTYTCRYTYTHVFTYMPAKKHG